MHAIRERALDHLLSKENGRHSVFSACIAEAESGIIIVDTGGEMAVEETDAMRVKVQKWGNSLALRIPRPFAREVAVQEGTTVDLSVDDGKLVVSPVMQGRYTLKQLLRGVTKDNIHGETDWGRPAGRESL